MSSRPQQGLSPTPLLLQIRSPPVCLEHGTLEPGWYIDVGTAGAPGEGALRDSIEIWLEALTFVASPTPIL